MKKLIISASIAASMLFAASTRAQAQEAMASAMPSDQLYQDLGQQAGLQQIVDLFVPKVMTDPRIASFFKGTNAEHLKQMLVLQFCSVSGGNCKYTGVDMKSAHAGMNIQKTDFNALVEDLQAAMDERHVPFTVQNRLLALLAPMHRDVISSK